MSNAKSILIIGQVYPEPATTAAGGRMLSIIDFFRNEGFYITFATTAQKSDYSFDLASFGVKERQIQLNSDAFDGFLKVLNPTVVLFDRFMVEEQFSWRVRTQCPNALRILSLEDLHSLRMYRQRAYKIGKEAPMEQWPAEEITQRELASAFRSDLVFCISQYEADLLKNIGVSEKNLCIWSRLAFGQEEMNLEGFHKRNGFVFVGNGKHEPNLDTIRYLKKTLWPSILKLDKTAYLDIYGAYLPEEIQNFHQPKERFYVRGWAQDLGKTLNHSRVMLCPIAYGAGLKGKIYQAMRYGLPVVGTPMATEGFPNQELLPIITAEDTAIQAKLGHELYHNASLWEEQHKKGLVYINQVFLNNTDRTSLTQKVEKTLENLSLHRLQNPIGMMLWHQSMTAAKYLGKWITLKNQDKI